MLGEQISELKGKIVGQRVLDVEGPAMETTVASIGNIRGTEVSETVTFVGSLTAMGVLHGVGKGVIMTREGEMATLTGEGVGRMSAGGNINWRGSTFYRTSSNGKLSFLNNLVGVFETQIDSEGNLSEKTWEWK